MYRDAREFFLGELPKRPFRGASAPIRIYLNGTFPQDNVSQLGVITGDIFSKYRHFPVPFFIFLTSL